MRLRGAHLLAILALSAALGCGGDPGSSDAGGPDAAADAGRDTSFTVAEPDIPWLEDGVPPIQMTPCPDGWREVTERDVTVCDPYPEGGALECDAGEAHFPGEPGCRAIGDPCPTGDYATALPTDGPVLYVNPSAAPGGDGSLGLPYAALADVAWPTLIEGTTIALSKGTFPGAMTLEPGVRLIGACALETTLTGVTPLPGSATTPVAVVVVEEGGAAAVLQNLTIANPPQHGAYIAEGGGLDARGVIFDRNFDLAVFARHAGTTVALVDTVIRGTLRDVSTEFESSALYAADGAHIEATRALLLDNHDNGAFLSGAGTELTLRDSVIRDSVAGSSTAGTGIYVADGGRIDLERVLVSGGGDGVWAIGSGASVHIADSVIAGTDFNPALDRGGHGVAVRQQASVDLARVLLTGHAERAILVAEDGSTLALTDSIIRGAPARDTAGDAAGYGLQAEDGSHVTATRVLIEHTADGVVTTQEGTLVTLADVAIRDSREPSTDALTGVGLLAQGGAHIEAQRIFLNRTYCVGIYVEGPGSYVHATDAIVQDTAASTFNIGSRGINVHTAGRFDGERLLVARNREVGIWATGPATTVALTDTTVRDTRPSIGVAFGDGIAAAADARVEGDRVLVDGAVGMGVAVYEGATARLRQAALTHIRPRPCDSEGCVEETEGFGAGSVGGTLSLTSFSIRDAETCGVFIIPGPSESRQASLDLESGEIQGSLIGACVQVEGYDLGRLSNDVLYLDNGTNLDSTTLPVPEAPAPLGAP